MRSSDDIRLVRVVPFYLGQLSGVLPVLERRLHRVFGASLEVRQPSFDPEVAFDTHRGQYNTRPLLKALLDSDRGDATRVLGLTSVDLFMPVLTHVFGEAQLGGVAAVVSLYRLRPEAYGLQPDEDLLRERFVKEVVHELGHTFGLVHCADPMCVMQSSTYAEEIDLKSAALCRSCEGRSAAK